MKKLPIGIQTFSELRGYDYVYVDKTEYIYRLTQGPKVNFLSRPRRFGKSLTISTLQSLYGGEKAYFEGLWIYDKWNWDKKNPIIAISFAYIDYKYESLENALVGELKKIGENYQIVLQATNPGATFRELIEKLHKTYGRVVILIDEYDKPIIDFLEEADRPIAYKNREILRNFYGIVKNADPYIDFFLMTGVSKFSQAGIFSNLNHLNDLTLDEKYVQLVGYTPKELDFYFKDWLLYVYSFFNTTFDTFDAFMDYVRAWYNGYSWDGINTVYNPYSILNFFEQRTFGDYWFKTGTPTFLLKLLREQKQFIFNDLTANNALSVSYDLENLNLRAILFQTGYLTVKHLNRLNGFVTLDYPNREVEQAFTHYILAELLHADSTTTAAPILQIKTLFEADNLEAVVNTLNAVLKSVPSHLLRSKKEDFYHALVHLYFRYLGLIMDSEVNTSDGRMDAVVRTKTHIYIIEFKLNATADQALAQMQTKAYADAYKNDRRPIKLVGINFSSRKRAISQWASFEEKGRLG